MLFRSPLKLVIAGAGAAGICTSRSSPLATYPAAQLTFYLPGLAIKILQAQETGVLGPVELVLYERESDYGGTWNVNTYPGCRCASSLPLLEFIVYEYTS